MKHKMCVSLGKSRRDSRRRNSLNWQSHAFREEFEPMELPENEDWELRPRRFFRKGSDQFEKGMSKDFTIQTPQQEIGTMSSAARSSREVGP